MIIMAVTFCVAGFFEVVRIVHLTMRLVGCLEDEATSGCPTFLGEYTTPLFLGCGEALLVGIGAYYTKAREGGGAF